MGRDPTARRSPDCGNFLRIWFHHFCCEVCANYIPRGENLYPRVAFSKQLSDSETPRIRRFSFAGILYRQIGAPMTLDRIEGHTFVKTWLENGGNVVDLG